MEKYKSEGTQQTTSLHKMLLIGNASQNYETNSK
jgi:hypothetical protein